MTPKLSLRFSALLVTLLIVMSFTALSGQDTARAADNGRIPMQIAGWAYRCAITVSNPNTVDLTNYQVKVVLTSSFDYSQTQPDGRDFRFTDTDGITLLDFWIESYNPTARSGVIWVEVPLIPASTAEKIIYMYYSNPSATSSSNGDNTFLFFDDFETPGSITSKWTAEGGTWTQETGVQQQDGTSGSVAQGLTTGNQILASTYSGGDYTLEAYGKQVLGGVWGLGAHVTNAQNLYSINLYEVLDNQNNLWVYTWVNGQAVSNNSLPVLPIDPGVWYRLIVKVHGSDIDVYFNNFVIPRTNAGYTNGKVALYGEAGTTAQFNNVLVRQYAASEPEALVGNPSPTAVTLIQLSAQPSPGGAPLTLLAAIALLCIALLGWRRLRPA